MNTLKFGNGEWYGKKDTILAYNDENSNFKPLPFSFDRASSATVVNKAGLIETVGSGEPRIDYKDDSKGALLLEPSRSNIVPYSEDFNNVAWNKISAIITPNNTISPDGTKNSDLFVPNSSGGQIYDGLGSKAASAISYTTSLYVKPKGLSSLRVYLHGSSNANRGDATFNLSNQTVTFSNNGAFTNTSASILSVGNGWYRCVLVTTSDTSTSLQLVIRYDGSTDNVSGLNLWGCQTEQGSYATSYIPTSGGAVTRVADACNNGANEQVINSTEGVLYFEGSAIANDGTFKRISVGTSDNLFANSIQLRYNIDDNSITYQFRVGNVYQADITTTINSTNINKIACVWETNRFEIWINGIKKAEDTSGSVPPSNTFNSLFFGKTSIGLAEAFKGNVKDLRVYNTALTDQELINLTTI